MTAATKNGVVDAWSYQRISLDTEGDAHGVGNQNKVCDRLAKTLGARIVHRVVDNDRSASKFATKEREGWTEVIDALRSGATTMLIAYDLDRLVRQPKELEMLIDLAESGTVQIHAATGHVDLSTPAGRLTARVLVAVAAQESENTSRRLRMKHQLDAEAGQAFWSGRRPYGFTIEARVVETEAVWIRQMYAWILDGYTPTRIARMLNDAGVEQPSRKFDDDGRPIPNRFPWQETTVKKLIRHPRNIGQRTYRGQTFDAVWPAVVDVETFNRANALLAMKTVGQRNGGRKVWTTGLVFCSTCGQTMYRTSGGSGRTSYRCQKSVVDPTAVGCGQSINADGVDAMIREVVIVATDTVRSIAPTAGEASASVELAAIDADLAELARMVGASELTMAEFRAARTPLAERRERAVRAFEAQTARDALAASVSGQRLAEAWDRLLSDGSDTLRQIAAKVIDRVTIAPTAPGARKRFDSKRVDVRLRSD